MDSWKRMASRNTAEVTHQLLLLKLNPPESSHEAINPGLSIACIHWELGIQADERLNKVHVSHAGEKQKTLA